VANPEHLEMVKKGTSAWNLWRGAHPGVGVELANANLKGVLLWEGDFSGADFSGADLTEASLGRTHFTGANLNKANLGKALLFRADLSEADLTGAILNRANVTEANLTRAQMNGTRLIEATMIETDLGEAHLSKSDLHGANLAKANLTEADLTGADLSGANLTGAYLTNANLTDTNLAGTNLTRAHLTRALFARAIFWDTVIREVDLSTCAGLENSIHHGPSFIDIGTLHRSKGTIPHKFLRNAGVPGSFIKYMASLTSAAFEYYSCFISYSSRDEEFAKRLHADLQTGGVRCWFAPEDMKIGDKIRPRLDEAIRVHDKLLLVLSENSVSSDWVETEVETAFARERAEKKLVLFPVRLDDSVFRTDVAWARQLKNTRHIGDFTNWKGHDQYQAAFERLLRDLKAEGKPEPTEKPTN
jgi:uncharacterized protein YjbI with pentapeptide repeats